MKILNIDAFAAPKRFLNLGGQQYQVKDVSVQSFIDNLKAAEELSAKGQQSPREQVEVSISTIRDAIPDLPEATIRGLSIEQLIVVLQFIRGEFDDKLVSEEAGAAAPADNKS